MNFVDTGSWVIVRFSIPLSLNLHSFIEKLLTSECIIYVFMSRMLYKYVISPLMLLSCIIFSNFYAIVESFITSYLRIFYTCFDWFKKLRLFVSERNLKIDVVLKASHAVVNRWFSLNEAPLGLFKLISDYLSFVMCIQVIFISANISNMNPLK
jgi:hypothetical protein